MEVRDFEFTTETTDAVFTEFLGKIKIGESWSQEGENWRRLIAIASHKGLTFVAKANAFFALPTYTLIQTVQEIKEKEIPEAFPESVEIETESRVTLLSINPSEKRLLVCQDAPWIDLYSIQMDLPHAVFKRRIELDARCVHVSWIDRHSFVAIVNQKAQRIHVKGKIEEWKTQERVVTLDVLSEDTVWVDVSDPAVLKIEGIGDVSLNRLTPSVTKRNVAEDTKWIINAVRMLKPKTALFTAAVVSGNERIAMAMGVVDWSDAEKGPVYLLYEEFTSFLPEEVVTADPLCNGSLFVHPIPNYNAWLIGLGEETEQPHRLIVETEELLQCFAPEDNFVWPLREFGDDALMLGTGIDFLSPITLASKSEGGAERNGFVVLDAHQDGLLILSALSNPVNEGSTSEVALEVDSETDSPDVEWAEVSERPGDVETNPFVEVSETQQALKEEETISEEGGSKLPTLPIPLTTADKMDERAKTGEVLEEKISKMESVPLPASTESTAAAVSQEKEFETESTETQRPKDAFPDIPASTQVFQKLETPLDAASKDPFAVPVPSPTAARTTAPKAATEEKTIPARSTDEIRAAALRAVIEKKMAEAREEEEQQKEQERRHREMIQTLRCLAIKYNDDVSKHVQQFQSVMRLAEMTKRIKMRTVDLYLRGRHAVERHIAQTEDAKLSQHLQRITKLKTSILGMHQIAQTFSFKLNTEFENDHKIEWDPEGTIEELNKLKNHLQRQPLSKDDAPPTLDAIKSTVETLLEGFRQQEEDNAPFQLGKDIADWVRPSALVTTLKDEAEDDPFDKMWSQVSDREDLDVRMTQQIPELPNEMDTYVLQKRDGTELQEWIPESRLEEKEDDRSTLVCGSESDVFQICTEEEIEEILKAQAKAKKQNESLQNEATSSRPAHVVPLSNSVLAGGNAKENPSFSPYLKLPPGPAPISMKQFLKNLGKDVEKEAENGPKQAPSPKEPRGDSPEPIQPISTPSTTSVTTSPTPPVVTTSVQERGSFQAGGFSAFGQPSQLGSGTGPQLGSLRASQFGMGMGTSSGNMGGGFGAYASGGNVFENLARGQTGQGTNAFASFSQQGQSNAFASFSQQGQPSAFGSFSQQGQPNAFTSFSQQGQPSAFGMGMGTSAFNVTGQKENSKLYEMRK